MALSYSLIEEGYCKVFYGQSAFDISKGYTAYPLHDAEVIEWCEKNCKSSWFRSPSQQTQTFVLFEDPHEALLFRLMWS